MPHGSWAPRWPALVTSMPPWHTRSSSRARMLFRTYRSCASFLRMYGFPSLLRSDYVGLRLLTHSQARTHPYDSVTRRHTPPSPLSRVGWFIRRIARMLPVGRGYLARVCCHEDVSLCGHSVCVCTLVFVSLHVWPHTNFQQMSCPWRVKWRKLFVTLITFYFSYLCKYLCDTLYLVGVFV